MQEKILEVKNLSVHYGRIIAVSDVSFTVLRNEIVTLIGSNGAGKSSSLMAISGVVRKSGGSVVFQKQNITALPAYKIAQLGIAHVPEGRKIFPELTVEENLKIGRVANKNPQKSLVRLLSEVYDLFPRLAERRRQAGGTLSGGEQQMLAIARGLMMEPELLILDEPSLGLAPIIVNEIFELILRVKQQGMTILLVEQNAAKALSIADRGYVLETGKVVISGTGKELSDKEEVKQAYLAG